MIYRLKCHVSRCRVFNIAVPWERVWERVPHDHISSLSNNARRRSVGTPSPGSAWPESMLEHAGVFGCAVGVFVFFSFILVFVCSVLFIYNPCIFIRLYLFSVCVFLSVYVFVYVCVNV